MSENMPENMSGKSQNDCSKCQDDSSKCQNDNRIIRVLEFLSAYQKQECLWNPALDSYKNKMAREEAYNNIIKDMNSTTLTIKDIKLKVKSVRTTYTKELRLLTKYKGGSKPYIPKLFWFSQANSFLKNVSLSRYKRNSSSLGKRKPVRKEEQLYDTKSTGPVDATTCIIGVERLETINNGINNDDYTQSNTKDQQQHHHHEQNQSQQELKENDILYIQHHHTQQHQQDQQQQKQEHNATEVTGIPDHPNCMTLSPSAKMDTIDNNDNTNGITGGGSDHDDNCVSHIIESQHNRGDINNIGYPRLEFNNTSTYVDGNGLDEYDHFCRSVAAQLRRIQDTYSRAFAKFKIQEILFEAETGHYRMDPANIIPVSQNINNNTL